MDGWPALSIHGDKSQQEREWVLQVSADGAPSCQMQIYRRFMWGRQQGWLVCLCIVGIVFARLVFSVPMHTMYIALCW